MKNLMSTVFLFFFVASSIFLIDSAYSTPVSTFEEIPDIDLFETERETEFDRYPTGEERGDRHRRVTCDLLSVSLPIGSLNHAACAANCLSLRRGYRGGRCRDGVCHCRR